MVDFKEISDAVIKGQAPKVKELVQKAVNEKATASDILQKGLIVGMGVIGERFKKMKFTFLKCLLPPEP